MKRLIVFSFLLLFSSVANCFAIEGGWGDRVTVARSFATILPAEDATYNIGSSTKGWLNLYIDGDIYTDGNMSIVGGTAVGIGTTAPQTALEVIGTAKATNLSVNVVAPTAKVDILNSGSEPLFKLGNSASGDVVTVSSAGFVGIGSTSPQANLEVDGDIYQQATSQTPLYVRTNYAGYAQFRFKNTSATAGASGDLVVEANEGTDTAHYLDIGVNGSGGGAAPFTTQSTSYMYTVDDNLYIGALGSNAIAFYTNGGIATPTERLRITSTGNVGIGSATPTSKLAVDGQIYLSNTTVLGGYVLCKEQAATGRVGHCTSLTAATGVCATCVVP